MPYDYERKINILDKNTKNIKSMLLKPNLIKINRQIPIEFKNQGLENLYKELDNYKPKTYEQYLDSFTHNF